VASEAWTTAAAAAAELAHEFPALLRLGDRAASDLLRDPAPVWGTLLHRLTIVAATLRSTLSRGAAATPRSPPPAAGASDAPAESPSARSGASSPESDARPPISSDGARGVESVIGVVATLVAEQAVAALLRQLFLALRDGSGESSHAHAGPRSRSLWRYVGMAGASVADDALAEAVSPAPLAPTLTHWQSVVTALSTATLVWVPWLGEGHPVLATLTHIERMLTLPPATADACVRAVVVAAPLAGAAALAWLDRVLAWRARVTAGAGAGQGTVHNPPTPSPAAVLPVGPRAPDEPVHLPVSPAAAHTALVWARGWLRDATPAMARLTVPAGRGAAVPATPTSPPLAAAAPPAAAPPFAAAPLASASTWRSLACSFAGARVVWLPHEPRAAAHPQAPRVHMAASGHLSAAHPPAAADAAPAPSSLQLPARIDGVPDVAGAPTRLLVGSVVEAPAVLARWVADLSLP
jgi:hypothetical protein